MKKTISIILFVFFGLFSCKEKYVSGIHVPAAGYLVVEGFINVGNGPTDIQLTRSSSLDSPAMVNEEGAEIEIQSSNGASYALTPQGSGHYVIDQVPVDSLQQYRLHIKTTNNKEYQTDYSPVKISPPIDSVNWTANSQSVNIYVSTHDPQDSSRYYQWSYEETWEYTSKFASNIEYQDGAIVNRPDKDQVHVCWITDESTHIAIASSANLSSDVIYQYLLLNIPYNSTSRLGIRYSILVKQYVLTKDWYEWNQKIKRNTEQLGSIFDAQPSETGGNVHCINDPTEKVIGFVGCTSETEKRIFINNSELPPAIIFTGYEFCEADTISVQDAIATFSQGYLIPTEQVYINGTLIGYQASDAECVDCRLKGGVLTKPLFW